MAYREFDLLPAKVQAALMTLNSEPLRRLLSVAMARKPYPTRKADMATVIDSCLTGSGLHALWNALDSLQQFAVAEATHDAFGLFRARRFEAKYGEMPKGYRLKGYHETSILRLFLYPCTSDGPLVFMPNELAMRLRSFVPTPEKAKLDTRNELPDGVQMAERGPFRTRPAEKIAALTQRNMERAAQQDLLAVLRLIDNGKVSVGAKTRHASATAVRNIAGVLAGGDFYDLEETKERGEQTPRPIRTFAWPWLMQAGRLVEQRGSKLALTKTGQQTLRQPPADTLRLLWQRWMKNKLVDEFNRINVFKGQTSSKGKQAMTSPASRRAKVESAMRDCPVGVWVSIDEFWRYLQAAGFDFEVTLEEWRLYILNAHHGTLYFTEWSTIQGRYVSCLLLEYAATLGMIDVALTPPA